MAQPPKVFLFDIGGVCVASPFRAILDYEAANNIPQGWINTAISISGKSGTWARLERGEIPLDSSFFTSFTADLRNEKLWRKFYISHLSKTRGEEIKDAAEEAEFMCPPPPTVDSEALYWDMMRVSRAPDPHMWPALQRLRKVADAEGKFLLGALSNTSIFPEGHEFNDANTPAGRFHAELKGVFDVFVSSAHVGMRKPDPEIYEYAVDQLDRLAKKRGRRDGVKAGDIVFLDDIGTNLRTAKRVGMRTIKVELGHADKAVAELERLTGLDLKGPSPKL